MFGFLVFVVLWVLSARFTVRHVWKTAEPCRKNAWEDYSKPMNHRRVFGEPWNAKELTTSSLFMWPLILVTNFMTSKPNRPGPWARFINWMSPREDTDA